MTLIQAIFSFTAPFPVVYKNDKGWDILLQVRWLSPNIIILFGLVNEVLAKFDDTTGKRVSILPLSKQET